MFSNMSRGLLSFLSITFYLSLSVTSHRDVIRAVSRSVSLATNEVADETTKYHKERYTIVHHMVGNTYSYRLVNILLSLPCSTPFCFFKFRKRDRECDKVETDSELRL